MIRQWPEPMPPRARACISLGERIAAPAGAHQRVVFAAVDPAWATAAYHELVDYKRAVLGPAARPPPLQRLGAYEEIQLLLRLAERSQQP